MAVSLKETFTSLPGKILILTGLIVLLRLPLWSIELLGNERERHLGEAEKSVTRGSGGPITLRGPLLDLSYSCAAPSSQSNDQTSSSIVSRTIELLPRSTSLKGTITPELRMKGIYSIPTYRASLSLSGVLTTPPLLECGKDEEVVPGSVVGHLALGVDDPRVISDASSVTIGDQAFHLVRETRLTDQRRTARASFPISPGETRGFTMAFAVRGTRSLLIAPEALTWDVELSSSSNEVGVAGTVSPTETSNTDSSFTAHWNMVGALPANPSTDSQSPAGDQEITVGVRLLSGIDAYRMVERAIKYSLLFTALTFLILALYEVLANITLHPVHYLLVGGALTVFYLLLLSLSEHLGFSLAYFWATLSVVSLIGGYTASILRSWRRGGTVCALLGLLYGYLFALLHEDEYALVAGSLGLTVFLGAVMYLTRRIDWYRSSEQ